MKTLHDKNITRFSAKCLLIAWTRRMMA